jgi:hypothetical protein
MIKIRLTNQFIGLKKQLKSIIINIVFTTLLPFPMTRLKIMTRLLKTTKNALRSSQAITALTTT